MLNAINRAIYIYFGFLTKTTIIGHYTMFHGLTAQVSMESFIKKIRWKVFFLDKNSESNEQLNNNFGFKSLVPKCVLRVPYFSVSFYSKSVGI